MFSLQLITIPVKRVNKFLCYTKNFACYYSSLNQINPLTSSPERRFKILDGHLKLSTNEYQEYLKLNENVNNIFQEKRKKSMNGGGDNAILYHTQKNKKLLARKRIELLVDRDYPLLEIGMFSGLEMSYGDICSAGVVVVIGKISNQLCIIGANDATVKGFCTLMCTYKYDLFFNKIIFFKTG